jgi:hypothetical protein
MAATTGLKRAMIRIAESLNRFAKEHSWNPDDYSIYYKLNTIWDKIHVLFISRHFEAGTHFENYVSVMETLEQDLADEPGLINKVGLVVRSSKQVAEGGIYAIGPEFREFRLKRYSGPGVK